MIQYPWKNCVPFTQNTKRTCKRKRQRQRSLKARVLTPCYTHAASKACNSLLNKQMRVHACARGGSALVMPTSAPVVNASSSRTSLWRVVAHPPVCTEISTLAWL